MPIIEAGDPEKIKMLKISLDELRRFYDNVSNIYDQLRVKALALIAGELAIVAFIFTNDAFKGVPDNISLIIFFFFGIIMLVLSMGTLFWTISSFSWKIPHDLYDSQTIYKSYESEKDFLEYLHDDYIGAIKHCSPLVERKAKRFNWTIYLLSAGIIILVIIKYGGIPT